MQETKTIRVKKCPYCFRNISNEDAGFLLRTDGVRFQSPALNEVFSYKTDVSYLYFWSAMGIPEEQIDARRIIIDNVSAPPKREYPKPNDTTNIKYPNNP